MCIAVHTQTRLYTLTIQRDILPKQLRITIDKCEFKQLQVDPLKYGSKSYHLLLDPVDPLQKGRTKLGRVLHLLTKIRTETPIPGTDHIVKWEGLHETLQVNKTAGLQAEVYKLLRAVVLSDPS